MKGHAGRCIQALHRLQAMLSAEFDDLQPPDIVWALAQLQWTYHNSAHRTIVEGMDDKP